MAEPEPLLFWCETDRAYQRMLCLAEALGRPAVIARSVAEMVSLLRDQPRSELAVVSFVGLPLPHALAACRRFREAVGDRRLRLLALLEPAQLQDFQPTWGVDDFALFPGDAGELAARLNLLLWRSRNLHTDAVIKIGPLLVNRARHEVLLDNAPVTLTVKEYELLLFLIANQDRVLTREGIVEAVWGHDYYGGERTVDVHIRRLRAKLPAVAACIETVHGVGYRFTPALAGK